MNYFWIWLIISVLCLVLDLVLGAFVLFFFALSSVLLGAITYFISIELYLQIILFAVLGMMSLLLFRQKLIHALSKHPKPHLNIGDTQQILILETRLEPQQETRISYQGSWFTAVNVDHRVLEPNTPVKIIKTDGIKLHIVANS